MSIVVIGQWGITLLSLYTLLWAFRWTSLPKIRYYLLLAFAVFLYAAGFMLELSTHTLEAAYVARRVQSYGACFYALLLYLFIRDYTNRPVREPWKVAVFSAIPAVSLLFANSYPMSRLYFADMEFDGHLAVTSGPLLMVQTFFNLAMIAATLYETVRRFSRETREGRVKHWTFFLATALPVLSMLVFNMDPVPIPVQAGIGILVITQLILGHFIMRRCARDWMPFARESVVQYMGDGYALVDSQMRLMDINETTGQYFRDYPAGTPVSKIPGFPVKLLEKNTDGQETEEFSLATPDGEIWLQASATPIHHKGELVCTCVLLYDITDKRKRLKELEDMAIHDALTGLHNRGSFFRLAGRDCALHLRTGQKASLLMLDIDFFKKINDTYGHQAGDLVLTRVAQLLRSRLRRTDLAGRYGGEEFSAFLPDTDKAGAVKIAEEIRREVERLEIPYQKKKIRVTASIGVAVLSSLQHETFHDLVADADAALYTAKRSGRNQVVAATPVLLSSAAPAQEKIAE